MENTRFLYGAAVQGIQGFIFQTNELKDIVGASELVENICTSTFRKLIKDTLKGTFDEESAIVMAAGNIKYIFTDEDLCRKVVLEFPKIVTEMAPGITISQAVVAYKDFKDSLSDTFENAVWELENRLRIQRNKPLRSVTLGAIGILRSRKTGLPAVMFEDDEPIDLATKKKRENFKTSKNSTVKLCKKLFGRFTAEEVAYDIGDIAEQNNWIAVIHADGNGLGQVVQKVGSDPVNFKKFSVNLDKATIAAARNAYFRAKPDSTLNGKIPMRPIVLGGDDLTVICRADIALDFARYFLEEFEYCTGGDRKPERAAEVEQSIDIEQITVRKTLRKILEEKRVFKDGHTHLSVCAGIAYIKSSYPFYYGYNLAETLCTEAKKEAKSISGGMENLPSSCLMFHKVQSSFIEEFEQIERKELIAYTVGKETVTFKFGPYYLNEPQIGESLKLAKRWTLATLQKNVDKLMKEADKEGSAVKNHLREWINLLLNNPGFAAQKMKRLKVQLRDKKELLELVEEMQELQERGRVPVYDLLSLCSVLFQKTKKREGGKK